MNLMSMVLGPSFSTVDTQTYGASVAPLPRCAPVLLPVCCLMAFFPLTLSSDMSQEESWNIWGKRSAVRRERNNGCRMGAELRMHRRTFSKAAGTPNLLIASFWGIQQTLPLTWVLQPAAFQTRKASWLFLVPLLCPSVSLDNGVSVLRATLISVIPFLHLHFLRGTNPWK